MVSHNRISAVKTPQVRWFLEFVGIYVCVYICACAHLEGLSYVCSNWFWQHHLEKKTFMLQLANVMLVNGEVWCHCCHACMMSPHQSKSRTTSTSSPWFSLLCAFIDFHSSQGWEFTFMYLTASTIPSVPQTVSSLLFYLLIYVLYWCDIFCLQMLDQYLCTDSSFHSNCIHTHGLFSNIVSIFWVAHNSATR